MIELRFQLRIDSETRIGPGKIALLEAVARAGSITAAGRELDMTYRRAWELIDHMKKAFGQPLVIGHTGSAGGAALTELGREVVRRYRLIEDLSQQAAAPHLDALGAFVITTPAAESTDGD